MKRNLVITAVVAVAIAIGCVAIDRVRAQDVEEASPIYGVTVPDGYRKWELIAPALEGDPLNELRAVVGNTVAMDAYRDGALPFPDGTSSSSLHGNASSHPSSNPHRFRVQPRRYRS